MISPVGVTHYKMYKGIVLMNGDTNAEVCDATDDERRCRSLVTNNCNTTKGLNNINAFEGDEKVKRRINIIDN